MSSQLISNIFFKVSAYCELQGPIYCVEFKDEISKNEVFAAGPNVGGCLGVGHTDVVLIAEKLLLKEGVKKVVGGSGICFFQTMLGQFYVAGNVGRFADIPNITNLQAVLETCVPVKVLPFSKGVYVNNVICSLRNAYFFCSRDRIYVNSYVDYNECEESDENWSFSKNKWCRDESDYLHLEKKIGYAKRMLAACSGGLLFQCSKNNMIQYFKEDNESVDVLLDEVFGVEEMKKFPFVQVVASFAKVFFITKDGKVFGGGSGSYFLTEGRNEQPLATLDELIHIRRTFKDFRVKTLFSKDCHILKEKGGRLDFLAKMIPIMSTPFV